VYDHDTDMRGGKGTCTAAGHMQRLCEKSDSWDQALFVSKRQAARTQTHAKLSEMLSSVESASYTDYIGRSLHAAPLHAAPDRVAGAASPASRPIAIPASSSKGRLDEFFPLDHGHSDFSCSVDDLHAARNMWVPRMTPPCVDEDRYTWAVDLLEGAMAMGAMTKATGSTADKHPYAEVSGIHAARHSTQDAATRANPSQTPCAGETSDAKMSTRARFIAGKAPVQLAFSCPLDGWNTPECWPVGPADV
jgi:hypothetical protein